ncbi:hypothetical protein FUAX_54950 (plasmid) [Fulvitalea axinellae]|uniref:ParB-like N-terminal domain-containing protein n=1 Tax=Fulvitalea axinellae TaxID=1182444 RepID=A0AAU9CSI4_9BACT|nr:hypothetical protein FUAX_54950 [Fulvitalea axinellae]
MSKNKKGFFAQKPQKSIFGNTTSVKDNLTVLQELEEFIHPLTAEETEQLEENIARDGVREPLIVWEDNDRYVLVDGHNRYRIARSLGIDFKIRTVEFADTEAVKHWMINNQLGRRNITKEQRAYFIGQRYLIEKKRVGAPADNKNASKNQTGQNVPFESTATADVLAKEYGISDKTVKRNADYAKGVDILAETRPEEKQKILTGQSKIKKADIQAVASGKKTAEEVLPASAETISTESGDKGDGSPSPSLNLPVKETFESESLTPKEIDKLNRLHGQLEKATAQLFKSGFSKTDLKWILGQVVKGVEK